MPLRLSYRPLVLVVLLCTLLAGCSSKDDESEGNTPTPVPATQTPSSATQAPTAATAGLTQVATAGGGAATVPASLVAGSGQPISDGICQASIPDDWVDDGTGHGTTTSGAKYELFGGLLKSSDDWKEAVDLVKSQAATIDGAKVSGDDNFVRVDLPDDHGFEYRGHFADRYCDFSVTSTGGAIPPAERGAWDAIIASLAPAS
jgi:hypothetical protein